MWIAENVSVWGCLSTNVSPVMNRRLVYPAGTSSRPPLNLCRVKQQKMRMRMTRQNRRPLHVGQQSGGHTTMWFWKHLKWDEGCAVPQFWLIWSALISLRWAVLRCCMSFQLLWVKWCPYWSDMTVLLFLTAAVFHSGHIPFHVPFNAFKLFVYSLTLGLF